MPKLVNMSIEETSGVDHPAHLREGWMVMKSTEVEAADLLNAIRAEIGHPDTPEDTMSDEQFEVEADTVAELAKANERIAELEAALAQTQQAEVIEETVDEEAELLKSVPESVRKMIEDQRVIAAEALAKAAATEEELRKERTQRADEAAIAKAASWESLNINAQEFGPLLRKAAEVDAELATAIEVALDAVNAQAESAGIFAEIGKAGRAENGDAYETLSALAKSAVETGLFSTFEQAFVKVAEQNPDLYNRHLEESGK